jgi:phospholipase/lecithinase/hemolysin
MRTPTLKYWLAASALTVAAVVSAPAQAFGSLTVFGDSLSDSGNNALVIGANGGQTITGNSYIPTQPYAFGAYTNGTTWVNSFAAALGLPSGAVPFLGGGGNYAFGGARTSTEGALFGFPPSALTQVGAYLSFNPVIDADALFVLAIGGNDVRDTGVAVAADPANGLAIAIAAADAYATGVAVMVDALQTHGANHIVVWGAPDVGVSPAALAQGPFAAGTASFISLLFNDALNARLAGLPGVIPFDLSGIVNAVVANPVGYGLSNVTDACGAVLGCDPSQYLFWDGIHPTSAGQGLLADAMYASVASLAAVPEPAEWMLMLAGVLAVTLLSRRRGLTPRPAPVR